MIFDMNTDTSSSIPMAEGYDGSIGCAKALIESAQNDYAMFRAMLESDAREIQAMKSGYVNESEIISLQEATVGGIWNKIKELFKKLIAKIKSIFANFLAKFRGLYMKDKELVKKYGQQVMRKSNLGNMSIKWRKAKAKAKLDADQITDTPDTVIENLHGAAQKEWSSDTDKRWETITSMMSDNGYAGKKSDGPSDYRESVNDDLWEDDSSSDYDFKEVFSGGAREMINEFDGGSKAISKYEKYVSKLTRALDKQLKEYDKFANQAAKDSLSADKGTLAYGEYDWNASDKQVKNRKNKSFDTDDSKYHARFYNNNNGRPTIGYYQTDAPDSLKNDFNLNTAPGPKKYFEIRSKNASHEYDMAVVFNDAVLIYTNCNLEFTKEYYKQLKAVFMKAVTISDKKLEESSIYAQAVAEAAMHEIDTIF